MVQARGHTVVRRHAKDGSSITILNQSIKYAQSDSGTVHPVSGWQDSVPAANNGKYIWTWIHIQYSDGSASDAYSVSRLGIDGKGVESSAIRMSSDDILDNRFHKPLLEIKRRLHAHK